MTDFLLLIVAIGTIVVLISKSHVFAGFRDFFAYPKVYVSSGIVRSLKVRFGILLNCAFCLSFWFSLASYFLVPVRVVSAGGEVTRGILGVTALWGLSSVFAGILARLFSSK